MKQLGGPIRGFRDTGSLATNLSGYRVFGGNYLDVGYLEQIKPDIE